MDLKVTTVKTIVLNLTEEEAHHLWDISNHGSTVSELVANDQCKPSMEKPLDMFLDDLWNLLESHELAPSDREG